jgi:3-demethoxyubiquinol 3-hydroxylase
MLDRLIIEFDKALKTLTADAYSVRQHPDIDLDNVDLSPEERRKSSSLMRVNHTGEVCAQALYSGQALTARDKSIAESLQQASKEETEHLAWCEKRIKELGGHTSYLNPVWYAGSFALGLTAGIIGDRWNLGFLAETERQVGAHLDSHLQLLPANDIKSKAIVEQMKSDEAAHANTATKLGAHELPLPIKHAMKSLSTVMTSVTYYI